jgi:hypothetical protein
MEALNVTNKNFEPNVNVVNSPWGKTQKTDQKIGRIITCTKIKDEGKVCLFTVKKSGRL